MYSLLITFVEFNRKILIIYTSFCRGSVKQSIAAAVGRNDTGRSSSRAISTDDDAEERVAGDVLFCVPDVEHSSVLWASLAGADSAYLYRCMTEPLQSLSAAPLVAREPDSAVQVPPEGSDVAAHCYLLTDDGNALVLGMGDGRLRVHRLERPYDVSKLGERTFCVV